MIKIYLPLHNAVTIFKKQSLWISLLFFSILYTDKFANAQCPVITVSPTNSCGVYSGGPCNPLTVGGNADTYTWSPINGLFLDCGMTTPYNGSNTTVVYAAPTAYTVYTVTGTILASGCSITASTRVNYTPRPPSVTPNPAVMCLGNPAVKLKVANPPTSAQFCSGTVNIPVSDNNVAGASNSIAVSGILPSCTITGLTISINMQHPRIGDMVFVLRAPNGQVLNLDAMLTRTNNPGANFNNTIFSNQATMQLSNGVAPYTGTFNADLAGATFVASGNTYPGGPTGMVPTTQNWSALYGAGPVNGAWTLGLYDGITGTVGTLNSWCLSFSLLGCPAIPATPAVWSPNAGLYSDAAATFIYIPGTPVDSVWARPTPAGIYTYQVTVSSLPVPPVAFTNPTSLTIPGPNGVTASIYPFDITVSGLPTTGVRVSSVVLHGVTHTRSNDIDVLLQSPTGQNVILMSDVGASSTNATYTFIDSGPAMNIGGVNLTGTYKPTNGDATIDNFPAPGPGAVLQLNPTLAFFGNVANVNGSWRLYVFDDNGPAEQGIFAAGYTINFDIGIPGCISAPTFVPVIVNQPVFFGVQPANQTVCADGGASFSVIAGGSGTLIYQWQVSSNGGSTYTDIINGGLYSGANTATLIVASPPVSMNGNYYRVVVNGSAPCVAATSTAAILMVNPLPNIVITANPLIIGPSQTTTILSTVTPNPAAGYTWYYNNTVIAGAVSSSLLVSYGSPGDYQLKVTDVNGCTNLSNIITIANSFALNLYTYPNPSGGLFQVRYHSEVNSTLQRSLSVYNNRGEKLITKTFTQTIPYQTIDVDIRANGKGLYWVELRDADGKRLSINKVMIQ